VDAWNDRGRRWSVLGALAAVTVTYAAAAAANLFIPRLPPAHSLGAYSLPSLLRDFGRAVGALVRNPDASFSMTGCDWGFVVAAAAARGTARGFARLRRTRSL
jgi:hypothetical protein